MAMSMIAIRHAAANKFRCALDNPVRCRHKGCETELMNLLAFRAPSKASLSLDLARRCIHVAASREAVEKSIQQIFPDKTPFELLKYRFGSCTQTDINVIRAAAQAAHTSIPDNQLSRLATVSDLIEFVCAPTSPPKVKGIPSLELFAGDPMPANVSIRNYRKRRWSDELYTSYLRRSLSMANLLPPSLAARIEVDPFARRVRRFPFRRRLKSTQTNAKEAGHNVSQQP